MERNLLFCIVMLTLTLTASNAKVGRAQQPLLPEDLRPLRQLDNDENCDDSVTGQFYFKFCDQIEVTVTKYRTVMVDQKCVMYDPVKCCNVIVTKKVPKREPYEDTGFEPRERVFCKTFRVRLDDLRSLPDSNCHPSEFMNVTNQPFAPENLQPTGHVGAGENCDEHITGHFFFKLCDQVEITVAKERTVMVDQKCVVYDPVKCCNVIVMKKVPKKEPYETTEFRPRERLFSKTFRVHMEQLQSLPACNCSPSEFLRAGPRTNVTTQNQHANHLNNAKPAAAGDRYSLTLQPIPSQSSITLATRNPIPTGSAATPIAVTQSPINQSVDSVSNQTAGSLVTIPATAPTSFLAPGTSSNSISLRALPIPGPYSSPPFPASAIWLSQ